MKNKLYLKNWMSSNSVRTFVIVLIMAIVSALLFVSMYFSIGLNNSIDNMKQRLGADMMIVPEKSGKEQETLFVSGKPSEFYMKNDVLDKVQKVEGVKQAAPQLYIATLQESCCSMPIQAIGIDFEKDFTIKPWMTKDVKDLKDGEILIGNNVTVTDVKTLKFFGKTYTVKSKLMQTGLGFDNAIFMNFESAKKMLQDGAKVHPQKYVPNSEISSIMIKKDDNADSEQVTVNLMKSLRGTSTMVVMNKNFVDNLSKEMFSLMKYLKILLTFTLIMAIIVLISIFTVDFKDKEKQMATLRILGITKSKLKSIILQYSVVLSLIGAVIGIGLSILTVKLFSGQIEKSLDLAFMKVDAKQILMISIITLLVVVVISLITQIFNVIKISKEELALKLRGN
ncbi:ABC transporter permease [Finegoldia magna]|uniref:ABC transporter permease n=1 Tax=Finegoldia magna TaxID=1260 RepID=UPI0012AF6715|nr:FtsX-like permease family protein [Finegoldia magna]MSB17071.1 FtsX-like permease family protein [Finegoldia magna]MSD45876.1 FtsX-like permease family protein [Finegoldia magna]